MGLPCQPPYVGESAQHPVASGASQVVYLVYHVVEPNTWFSAGAQHKQGTRLIAFWQLLTCYCKEAIHRIGHCWKRPPIERPSRHAPIGRYLLNWWEGPGTSVNPCRKEM
eukprot:scaffold1850_cov357-Prasinococcus_capsulatus_cf.AAC.1